MTEIIHIARVYVVGPRNMFAIHHREVRGGDVAARGNRPRAMCVAREGAYEERHVCELNYKSYIGYLTEMIVKTAVVYVVGPRNTFVNH